MLNRILVALIGIPLLITVLLKGGFLLLLFVNFVILVGLFEFYKMAEIGGKKPDVNLGYIAGLAIPNIIYFTNVDNSTLILMPITLLTIALIGKKVLQNKVENSSRDIGVTLLGVVYISGLFTHLLLMNYLPNGGKWLLTIQILVWVCDSFAYFVGMGIGRKIFKQGFSSISPKKSIEGSIGGIVFTMGTIYLINKYFNIFGTDVSTIVVLLFGFLISIVAQIGDLGESMFKREFKVKDSGKLLGEHGGILDRFDSMLFVVPVVYYLLKFI
ncbi:MAG: phosphatidate cytidylyltransferase [Cetobacterium somerae]|uniref:Phosphatidate cytidylyltransferase n=1 Tax=Cetobacterium somerae ATCC BAA-474 TaxID=1319815 RepID=U7VDC0_9FUSO|nr:MULTISPECIES: phosphatidate cytidylyltransferase [Cetobacterium]ERT69682.1 phosphatidate cytidylyltransferase [Cetobacterium somerae ATCC BAA-474]MBC2853394.1 phosphatidate cytidylyltransferase [Cetobacterium sp. 2G large]MCQ9625806.1 phosphatidate cytidylyltransferase [Cetobacterium somerae]WVJ01559.1 phosphatidate cytidylyltransferase [Cetobacterium somerae]